MIVAILKKLRKANTTRKKRRNKRLKSMAMKAGGVMKLHPNQLPKIEENRDRNLIQ